MDGDNLRFAFPCGPAFAVDSQALLPVSPIAEGEKSMDAPAIKANNSAEHRIAESLEEIEVSATRWSWQAIGVAISLVFAALALITLLSMVWK